MYKRQVCIEVLFVKRLDDDVVAELFSNFLAGEDHGLEPVQGSGARWLGKVSRSGDGFNPLEQIRIPLQTETILPRWQPLVGSPDSTTFCHSGKP